MKPRLRKRGKDSSPTPFSFDTAIRSSSIDKIMVTMLCVSGYQLGFLLSPHHRYGTRMKRKCDMQRKDEYNSDKNYVKNIRVKITLLGLL
jgi:hypothetical protein